MERSKRIISIIVGLASILIIWKVGFEPLPQPTETQDQTQATDTQPGQAETPTARGRPPTAFDANEARRGLGQGQRGGMTRQTAETEQTGDPNDPLVAVNLNNVQMNRIVQMLTEWTGKVIMPTGDSMSARLTIYAPRMVPRSRAISLIYRALYNQGYVAEYGEDDTITIRSSQEAKLSEIPLITADYPLALFENKDQVVQRIFMLTNYSPMQMASILQPLMSANGHLTADEENGSLLIIDTVRNLMRYEALIQQFDIVVTQSTIEQVFDIKHRDPTEIIEMIEVLLSSTSSSVTTTTGAGGNARQQARGRGARGGMGTGGSASSVTIGTGRTPPVLVADITTNQIIAKAIPEDMEKISQWIVKLDIPLATLTDDVPLASIENKMQKINYVFRLQNNNASQIAQLIEPLLNEDGYLSADDNSRTLLVIDTVAKLIEVERVIKTFDIPEGAPNVYQIFDIGDGDPSEIVQLIELLLSETSGTATVGTAQRRTTTTGRGR